jgi:uncharacterized membrane protein (UPF0127 family)
MASVPMIVHNRTRGVPLATNARHARTVWTRLRGLLGTAGLEEGGGLVIEPCNSVHMFGMKYALDVVFADREGVVVGVVQDLRPWKATRIYRGARYAIELPMGIIASSGTAVGDELELKTE